jgi:hypothetical protein
MRCSRSVAKFECSEALARELCFAHGSNINARAESCGKLEASGCCAKCLAAKTGQGAADEILRRIRRFNQSEHWAISRFRRLRQRHRYPRLIVRNFAVRFRKEDFLMDRNRTRSTRLEARLSPETLALIKRAAEIEGRSVSDFAAARQAAQRTIAETDVGSVKGSIISPFLRRVCCLR